MTRRGIWLATLLAANLAVPALASDGAWKFVVDAQEHPILTYSEAGQEVFFVGCGHAFAVTANYPGAQDRKGDAAITIDNGKASMTLKGSIDEPEDGKTGPTKFGQSDLGYSRQDPGLYEKAWHALEDKFFSLIDSGKPLTISAEGKSYVLPPVDAPNWKARFKKIC
jgi:hypothetical protein